MNRDSSGIRFAGLAHRVPSQAVTNEDVLGAIFEESRSHLSASELQNLLTDTEAALNSAGTVVRYHRAAGEVAYELCVEAGRKAIANANLSPRDVDLLIYVGVGRGFLEPATANVFQDLLGLTRATCFDVLDACASWIRALDIARMFLTSGRYRTAMILNAEFMGREAHRYEIRSTAEFDHWFPGVTIGEAATATIITRCDRDDEYAASFRNWGEKRTLCLLPLPNFADYVGQDSYRGQDLCTLQFTSFGKPLLAFGVSKLAGHFKSSGEFVDYPYDRVFGHAASNSMCDSVGALCGIDLSKFFYTHHLYGNTVSASVPLAMSLAQQSGALSSGDRILLMVASAGVSTGIARFRFH